MHTNLNSRSAFAHCICLLLTAFYKEPVIRKLGGLRGRLLQESSGDGVESPSLRTERSRLIWRVAARITVAVLVLIAAVPALAQTARTTGAGEESPLGKAVPPATKQMIVGPIDDNQLVTLTGLTHPLARAEYDRGRVAPGMIMNDLVLVLKRSPEMEADVDAFATSQNDVNSPNYHKWLTPEEVGERFGVAQSDINALSGWLMSHGFSIVEVPKDRMSIRFNGTAALVESAFHTEIHNLEVNGEKHIANMIDPQIPAALAPVVLGIKSLNNFFPRTMHHLSGRVKWDSSASKWERVAGGPALSRAEIIADHSAGLQPETSYTQQNGLVWEDVSPWDFAAIYNVLPLWNETPSINGTGQTIYIAGRSNIYASDISYFQSTFDLPPNPVKVIITNSDPGYVDTETNPYDNLEENTSDVEMADAIAPGANIVLVTSCGATSANSCGASATSDGAYLSAEYIVNGGPLLSTLPKPTVMSFSYGACESDMYTDGSIALYGNLWQTAALDGLAVFVAAGDSGSAMCDAGSTVAPQPPDTSVSWVDATHGLAVSGVASTPYDTAVGGTDFYWTTASTYWNTDNSSLTQANAKGYIPEQPWNDTCASPMGLYDLDYYGEQLKSASLLLPKDGEEACDFVYSYAGTIYADLYYSYNGYDYNVNVYPYVGVAGGGGGKSSYVSQTLGTWFGYPKPSWQTGVTGIPNDSARDVPDVSFFAATGLVSGSSYLICVSTDTACNDNTFAEIGGTSLSSPAMAGVMALINQKMGTPQGSPNAELYDLAGKETYSDCSAETVNTSSTCLFNDIDEGSNSPACYPNSTQCSTPSSFDTVGIMTGYLAGEGYDLATGLGSLNVFNVVNAWSTVLITPTVTVTPSSTSITTSQALSVGVTVSGGGSNPTPTGSVTMTSASYTSTAATLSSSGSVTISISAGSLAAGSDTLTVNYTPDSTSSSIYNTATGTASVTVTASLASTTTTMTLSPNTVTVGSTGPVTLTATVAPSSGSGTPTGTVTFFQGTEQLGQPVTLSSGTASYSYNPSSLPTGTSPFSAVYSGDTTYSGSTSSPVNLTVTNLAATNTALTISPTTITAGSSTLVTATATVAPASGSGTPTGTVTFFIGTTQLGQPVTLSNGVATCSQSASTLAAGTYPITAVYSGDSTYAGSTSSAVNLTVTATVANVSFTVIGSSVTVEPGATTGNTSTITVTPTGGFTGSVTLTAAITSNPSGAQDMPTLSFGATSPVGITGSTAETATLTVTTTAATNSSVVYPERPGVPWYAAGGATLACLLLICAPTRQRRWRTMLGMFVLLVALAGGVISCGGGGGGGCTENCGGNSGTTAGTYTITVTGTSETTTETGAVTLTVQ